jgi:sporulation-control protein
MDFLSKMGAAVGVGAASVEVELPHSAYHWNDTVRGKLLLRGGTADQAASDVKVSVMEHWVTRDSDGDRQDHYQHYNETVVARDVNLTAGSSQEVPFEVTVPEGQRFTHDWYVHARVSIPRAADRHGQVQFKLLPPVSLMRAAEALLSVATFRLKSFGHHNGAIHFDFAPPEEKKGGLDGVKLMIRDDIDRVTGEIEINPQEHSMADRLKALMKKDRVRHDVSFSRQFLLESAEGDPPVEAVNTLRDLIQPYL